MLLELLLAFAFIILGLMLWVNYIQRSYWQKQGVRVPHMDLLFGNHPQLNLDVILKRRSVVHMLQEQYEEMKHERFYGTYMGSTPAIVIKDPDLFKVMLIRDFHAMADRMGSSTHNLLAKGNATDRLWANQLSLAQAEVWKDIRSTFSPIFTSGKMKEMTPFLDIVKQKLVYALNQKAEINEEFELRDVLGKYSMDAIASCAFGVDAKSFDHKESLFVKNASAVFRRKMVDLMKIFLVFIPGGVFLMKKFQISIFKPQETQFFVETVKSTLSHRQKVGQKRNDLVDMMMAAMKNNLETKQEEIVDQYEKDAILYHNSRKTLDNDVLIATSMVFLIAGYDTTGQTMSYLCYELARNQDIQDKLRQEIDDAIEANDGKLPDYQATIYMQYLEMVFQETLRRHPMVRFVQRATREDYNIPNSNVTIKKGTEVYFNVCGMHHDPKYFPDPHVFDPERFSKEVKAARHPYAFTPFGHGPRNCLGMRFAMLEAKMAVIALLANFKLLPSAKTVKGEIELDTALGFGSGGPKRGLWVKVEKRNKF